MFYIDNDSGVTVMPPVSAQRSAIVRWFSEGDGNNVITWPGMDWFNIVQAELLNTLEEAGIQPDKTKLNQLALSIKAIMNKNALLIKNNLSEIKTAGASAQRTARENLDIYDASLNKKGLVQLTSATDSPSETLAATAKAVKIAMDNANARLAKDRNGADIPNKPLFIQNVGLGETAKQAAGAVQKTGDEMSGKLTLPQTSSFGVNTNNTLGGSSIAIGDNDTGLKGNGDGNLAFMANNVLAGYFNENELQHSKKMLTKNFQALVDNNWPEGAGGFSGQLSSEAPFSVPMVHRQNNDNNFFPLLKGKVSLESGYPVAASFGILTSGNTNFPQIAIHAKTDFDVNDKIWVFDVATGEFRAPGRITATEILLSGKSRVGPDGNLYGDVWGGWLNDFLINNYNRKN
ncbi:tail fiber protein, partial [Salmonella enterica subsp. enterica serovar Montevideo]|nr:tail fiber protein [Salmonella enterica subsp. enterica serovar Montevideo]MDI8467327.1 tail fiber protein [Salmonella enterica subsp. enterica serovar Montevideo]MDI8569753.1 tail fiber protein [Salmonella enterica subsp. enterica serovar Montevideo]MDI8648161.1 tail fiber protein [Salmonella enterica subsp. enterica serovar Montevideo]MEA6024662.1 tail fiber protein [Salmonella enterica subsp. enterica serovar Montevideo]